MSKKLTVQTGNPFAIAAQSNSRRQSKLSFDATPKQTFSKGLGSQTSGVYSKPAKQPDQRLPFQVPDEPLMLTSQSVPKSEQVVQGGIRTLIENGKSKTTLPTSKKKKSQQLELSSKHQKSNLMLSQAAAAAISVSGLKDSNDSFLKKQQSAKKADDEAHVPMKRRSSSLFPGGDSPVKINSKINRREKGSSKSTFNSEYMFGSDSQLRQSRSSSKKATIRGQNVVQQMCPPVVQPQEAHLGDSLVLEGQEGVEGEDQTSQNDGTSDSSSENLSEHQEFSQKEFRDSSNSKQSVDSTNKIHKDDKHEAAASTSQVGGINLSVFNPQKKAIIVPHFPKRMSEDSSSLYGVKVQSPKKRSKVTKLESSIPVLKIDALQGHSPTGQVSPSAPSPVSFKTYSKLSLPARTAQQKKKKKRVGYNQPLKDYFKPQTPQEMYSAVTSAKRKKRELDSFVRTVKTENAIGSHELESRVTEEYLRNLQDEARQRSETKSIWSEMFSFGGKVDPEHQQSDRDAKLEAANTYIDYVLSSGNSKFDIYKVEVPEVITLSLCGDDELYFKDGQRLTNQSKVALLRASMLKKQHQVLRSQQETFSRYWLLPFFSKKARNSTTLQACKNSLNLGQREAEILCEEIGGPVTIYKEPSSDLYQFAKQLEALNNSGDHTKKPEVDSPNFIFDQSSPDIDEPSPPNRFQNLKKSKILKKMSSENDTVLESRPTGNKARYMQTLDSVKVEEFELQSLLKVLSHNLTLAKSRLVCQQDHSKNQFDDGGSSCGHKSSSSMCWQSSIFENYEYLADNLISFTDPLGTTFVMPCLLERHEEQKEEEVKDEHDQEKWRFDCNPWQTHEHRHLDLLEQINSPDYIEQAQQQQINSGRGDRSTSPRGGGGTAGGGDHKTPFVTHSILGSFDTVRSTCEVEVLKYEQHGYLSDVVKHILQWDVLENYKMPLCFVTLDNQWERQEEKADV